MKKGKPLTLKMSAPGQVHINKNFVTDGRFVLRASLFSALKLPVEPGEVMQRFVLNGRGTLTDSYDSYLTTEKIEKVFARADSEKYETERAELRGYVTPPGSEKVEYVKVTGGSTVAHVSTRYWPLYDRLSTIPGGEWQINSKPKNLKALRFVLKGKTKALLMPCKLPAEVTT